MVCDRFLDVLPPTPLETQRSRGVEESEEGMNDSVQTLETVSHANNCYHVCFSHRSLIYKSNQALKIL